MLNQCDGCQRGLPLKNGSHYNPDGSYDYIGCTKKLYVQEESNELIRRTREMQNETGLGVVYCRNIIKMKMLEEKIKLSNELNPSIKEIILEMLDIVWGR
jgi:hypothetical protein